jgi:gliding motility-associated transport system permease protein/gliding motility-associatede transport system auxiliary component
MDVKSNIWIGILLIIINVLLFNLILDRMNGLRADLTEGSIYSLSPVTERILGGLDEEVSIKAFISDAENLPEELRPHVPELMNLLREYEERSAGKVVVEQFIPEEDSKIEDEAQNTYGIQPQAFAFREQNQSGVKSFYFALAVSYAGSRPETIGTTDLIDRGSIFENSQTLKLKNVEFSLTRAIKRAVFGFEGQRNLFERIESKLTVTTFISADGELPELFRETPSRVKKVMEELVAESGGKLRYVAGELPTTDEEAVLLSRRRLIEPFAYPGSEKPFYLWASLEVDDQLVPPFPLITLDGAMTEFQIRESFEGIFRQLAPGGLRAVAVVQKSPPPANPMMGMQAPPPARFSSLVEGLRGEYDVRSLDPGTLTAVPREVEVLIVPSDGEYSERAVYAIDQFVMRGGKAIFTVDGSDVSLQSNFAITATKRKTGLEDLLKKWGVRISDDLVLDAGTRGKFFWARRKGAMGRRQAIVDFKWAALPTMGYREGTVNRDLGLLAGFEVASFWFPHAVETEEVEGIKRDWVFRSTEEAWFRNPETGVDPEPELHPESGYAVPAEAELASRDLGVLLTGRFPSLFADRAIPAAEAEKDAEEKKEESEKSDEEAADAKPEGAPLKTSQDTRVLVVANDDWIDDQQAQLSRFYPDYGYYRENENFLKNTIAWMLEDDDLVQVRNRGRSFRPLEELDEDQKSEVQLLNFVLPLALLALLGVGVAVTRFNRRPTL